MTRITDPKQLFEEVYPAKLQKYPEWGQNLDACFEFEVTGDGGGLWCLNLKGKERSIQKGAQAHSDCRITMSVDNFKKLMNKDLNVPMALMTRKIKVTGSMTAAMKLKDLFA